VNFSPLQVLRVRAFYAIAFTFAARQLVSTTVAVFLIPFLQERGMSLTQAAGVLSIMALAGAPGRVIFGWLGDIFPKRYVMATCFVFQSVGLLLFTYLPGMWGIAFFLILYAPMYAGVLPLIPAIQAEYFGREWFGTIRGMMTPIMLTTGVIGPFFAGTVFDLTGSYRPAFTVLAGSILLALTFILLAKPPKVPAEDPPAT
jgi:MFS family permease